MRRRNGRQTDHLTESIVARQNRQVRSTFCYLNTESSSADVCLENF